MSSIPVVTAAVALGLMAGSASGEAVIKRTLGSNEPANGQLRDPWAIAVDDSQVYVADLEQRIQVFDSQGNFLRKWGTSYVPEDMAVDPTGNIYLVSDGLSVVGVFDAQGNFLREWGSYGSGDGQLNQPSGIAIDGAANVYVADEANHRVQVFDSQGNFLRKWGSEGTGDGQFIRPNGIAVDGAGNVYVSDPGDFSSRIQVFDSQGNFLRKWGSSGSGGVSTDGGGHVYITGNTRIQVFDPQGNFLREWGSLGNGDGQFGERGPLDVSADDAGNIYVADTFNHRIQAFDSQGNFVRKWGSKTFSGNGEFNGPQGLAVDPAGNLFIADSGNNRIQAFDAQGNFLLKWGSLGGADGQFGDGTAFGYGTAPADLAIDDQGNLYATDDGSMFEGNDRVQVFDLRGSFLRKWGSFGTGGGRFGWPIGITTDGVGRIYVADAGNHTVQVFDSQGNFLREWGSVGSGNGQFSELFSPLDLAVDHSGDVYVTDPFRRRIQVFDSQGNFLRLWSTAGFGSDQNWWDASVAVGLAGQVYVFDKGNGRILVFDSQGNFLRDWQAASGRDLVSGPLAAGIAADDAGNVYVVDGRQIQMFAIVPSTSLDSHPAAQTGRVTPRFTFSGDEFGSTFECREDERAWSPCTSPYTTRPLPDGRHTFRVRGVYGENADPTPARFRFSVETRPQTTISEHPSRRTHSDTVRFAFAADERASFECKLDSKPWRRCSSPRTYRNLDLGVHSFRVRATDRIGSTDATPAKWRWRILGSISR